MSMGWGGRMLGAGALGALGASGGAYLAGDSPVSAIETGMGGALGGMLPTFLEDFTKGRGKDGVLLRRLLGNKLTVPLAAATSAYLLNQVTDKEL
jgi:hypothetical protein